LVSHTNLGVLVGYTDTDRMITVYNPTKHTLKAFRDVVIDEDKRWLTRFTQCDVDTAIDPNDWKIAPILTDEELLITPDLADDEEFGEQNNDNVKRPLDMRVQNALKDLAISDENEEDEFHDPNTFPEVVYTRPRSPSPSLLPFSVFTRPKRVTHAPRKYADEQAAMAETEREKKGSKRLNRDSTF
jgi:hypothetical protein